MTDQATGGIEITKTMFWESPRIGCRTDAHISGYNAGFIANEPWLHSDGTLLVPFFVWPWEEHRQRHTTRKQSAVLRATWTADLADLEWDLGQYIEPTGNFSSMAEVTVAELRDGSLLGILRTGPVDPAGAPTKAYCISRDGGRTWGPPKHLTYDDGQPLYSPLAISRLIRSSRNGKLYWIANILPCREDMYADVPSNRHRFILQIAEVNEDNGGIKAETVTTIDESRDPSDPREYSNACTYEDRDTGDLILTMCEACALPLAQSTVPDAYDGGFMTSESFTSHSYRYVLKLPGASSAPIAHPQ